MILDKSLRQTRAWCMRIDTQPCSAAERLHDTDVKEQIMADLETQAALSEARKAASAASYDIQKLPEDSVERQALHNLLTAVDYLIQAADGSE
ncbi:hypothetical protein ITJ38_15505 [Agreia pratensis]|nr:hypothetical protein [Agreia pratensis]MBF4635816.1 hypothetical protein [Agreia pratensis]